MTLASLSFYLLAAGAFGGVALLLMVLLHIVFPRWFGAGHGLLNLAGVALLFAANLLDGDGVEAFRWWALGILVAALSGGLIFFRALFPARIPAAVAALHGGIALLGLYILAPVAGLR
jgi:hypothetical protein